MLKNIPVKWKSLSCIQLFATPWTIAHQSPLSMKFFRQEYWSGLPFSSSGDLPNPGIEPESPALQADSLRYRACEQWRFLLEIKKIRHQAWWFPSSSQQRGLWGLTLTFIFMLAQGGSHAVNRVAAAAAKSLQSCPTLLDSMDCSPPGSSVHGVFQARVLELGAIAFSKLIG